MEFLIGTGPQSIAEERVWNAIKKALQEDEGFAVFNFPLLGKTGVVSDIDIVIVHREWGLFALEIKGYKIESIAGVDVSKWLLRDGQYANNPDEHLNRAIWLLYDQLRGNLLVDRLPTFSFVALPFIRRNEWREKKFDQVVALNSIIFSGDLTSEKLRLKFQNVREAKGALELGHREWNTLKNILIDASKITLQVDVPFTTTSRGPERDESYYETPILIGDYERDLPSIFISYRRRDSAWAVRLIADELGRAFEDDIKIFLDVDSIGYGDRFDRVIEDEIKKTNVIMVIIGPSWLTLSHQNGMRRLDDPNDYVVKEIAAALENGKTIIPIILDGTELPRSGDLPERIRDLSLSHAMKLTTENFRSQMEFLIKRLRLLLKVS